jgi:hypothetical protein
MTSLGGNVACLMTFPERGIVVAVISNTSYAETETLALTIAQARRRVVDGYRAFVIFVTVFRDAPET